MTTDNLLNFFIAGLWSLATLFIGLGIRVLHMHRLTKKNLTAIIPPFSDRETSKFNSRPLSIWKIQKAQQAWEQGQNAAILKLRFTEYLLIIWAGTLVPGILGYDLRGLLGSLILAPFGAFAVWSYFRWKKERILQMIERNLPDFLRSWATALRAGHPILQAMALAAAKIPDPLGFEIRRVLHKHAIGYSLEESLQELTTRIPSSDLHLAVMVINIQRETGGSMAEILDDIVATIAARQRLAQEVRALTAQGRLSAWVLTALPLVLGVFFWYINPTYMDALFHTLFGDLLVSIAAFLVLVGGVLIHRLVRSPEL
ncbi:type II secretion system F family protein [Sulfoacidibacillus thermotolerans]|uniref:Type II secretion system protein GspF domain-containing protein n=1 Tax=Sulfoacidibacillus thermotolerans TaxID=1765684 RepID=A0A2U3DCS4_SULT2|nr:type II secretion system F family protein [Sulfoacidibacillus thermotolerans]PWI59084.1 hypothetical protein BM613_00305 [Sulfoacidibacillus thermotolerans]